MLSPGLVAERTASYKTKTKKSPLPPRSNATPCLKNRPSVALSCSTQALARSRCATIYQNPPRFGHSWPSNGPALPATRSMRLSLTLSRPASRAPDHPHAPILLQETGPSHAHPPTRRNEIAHPIVAWSSPEAWIPISSISAGERPLIILPNNMSRPRSRLQCVSLPKERTALREGTTHTRSRVCAPLHPCFSLGRLEMICARAASRG